MIVEQAEKHLRFVVPIEEEVIVLKNTIKRHPV
jgi:hypothetical protein